MADRARGRHQGEVVGEVDGETVEVLAYYRREGELLIPTGKADAFVYTVGPRGGVRPSETFTDADRLRRKARRLLRTADMIEAYLAEQGPRPAPGSPADRG